MIWSLFWAKTKPVLMRAMSQNADGHEFDMSPMADNADDTVERVSLIDHDEGPTDIIFSRKSDDTSLWDTFKVTLRDARGRSLAAFVISCFHRDFLFGWDSNVLGGFHDLEKLVHSLHCDMHDV